MRNYIFNFSQEILIKLDVSYYWISYKKILQDLPFVFKNERAIRRELCDLENKLIIKRKIIDNKKLYLWIDKDYLFTGKKYIAANNLTEKYIIC